MALAAGEVFSGGVVRDADGRQVIVASQGSPDMGSTVAVAAGVTGDTVVKATPGTLLRVLVTATGTGVLSIYDNATGHTGTVIGTVPANPVVGTTYVFQMPAANGITVAGAAANPGVTISFA